MTEHIVMVGALNADLAIRVDRLPSAGETVSGREPSVLPGGKASNQAVAAARLGGLVRLVGAVGDDENGRMLREHAAASGVDVSFVAVLDAPTGQAIIPVDDAGENLIVLVPGANGELGVDDIPAEAYTDAGLVCVSLEVPLAAVQRAASLATAASATVLLNPSPFRPLPHELLDAVDVLVLNEVEAAQLMGARTVEPVWPAGAEALRDVLAPHRIGRIVVTRGGAGSIVVDGDSVSEIAATEVEPLDTTGAGDAFVGALAVGLARGLPLVDAAREASVVAAFSTTRRGAQPSYPTPAELADFR